MLKQHDRSVYLCRFVMPLPGIPTSSPALGTSLSYGPRVTYAPVTAPPRPEIAPTRVNGRPARDAAKRPHAAGAGDAASVGPRLDAPRRGASGRLAEARRLGYDLKGYLDPA